MSLPTKGDFSCADLQIILATADEIWTDDIRKAEYVAHATAAIAIKENQTARFAALENPNKDREIKVVWVDDCDTEAPSACTDQCVIEGDEAGASCVEYGLTQCIQKEYKTTREQFKGLNLELEEVVAIQLLKKMKLMDEALAVAGIEFLDFNSGVNKYPGEFSNSGGNVTLIPPAAWNEDLFGYLMAAGEINMLPNMKMLSGVELRRLFWKLQAESSAPGGQAALNKIAGFSNPYFDLFKLQLTTGAKTTFLWNPNSVALVTKTYNDGTPRVRQNPWQMAVTIPSYNIPGVSYDWTYMPSCSGNDWTDAWRLQVKFDYFLNPIGCDSEKTGIIQLECGTA